MASEPRDELGERTEEFRLLQWITSEINATLDLDDILETVLRTMDELFGFRHSLILLVDEGGASLTVVASRGYLEKSVGAKVSVGTGLIGVAAKKRKIVRVSNLGQQRAYFSSIRSRMREAGREQELSDVPDLPGLPNAESQIAIPLMIKDTLIGVFAVETAERHVFGEREESLVTIVANHAASSIHNAKLYRMEADRRAELAKAHEVLTQLTETLEERVRERTEELERRNRELRETQAQLLQSAKLASLGDLVAGVAHEINTPLGSIHANADLAGRAVKVVEEAMASARPAHPRLAQALAALTQAASTTRIASERILAMVTSLRQFARLDEAERKKANLHQGIDSTLELLRHRIGARITVVRDFGEIPDIVCFPIRLNQVFMNLLVNALQAMGEEGTITVRSRMADGDVVLEFEDTGPGIPESIVGRIFDPGFTTKGVRVGMGLGLSISYRIVHDHGGKIEVASEPGKGARFTVRLPVSNP